MGCWELTPNCSALNCCGIPSYQRAGSDWSSTLQTTLVTYLDRSRVHTNSPTYFMAAQGYTSLSPTPSLSRGGELQMTHVNLCESCIPELGPPILTGRQSSSSWPLGRGWLGMTAGREGEGSGRTENHQSYSQRAALTTERQLGSLGS